MGPPPLERKMWSLHLRTASTQGVGSARAVTRYLDELASDYVRAAETGNQMDPERLAELEAGPATGRNVPAPDTLHIGQRHTLGCMRKLEVDWNRIRRDRSNLPPPTPGDVSRALDGTPLDTPAAVVRHMADLEDTGVVTHTGRMFRDAREVLDREGEAAMLRWLHRQYADA